MNTHVDAREESDVRAVERPAVARKYLDRRRDAGVVGDEQRLAVGSRPNEIVVVVVVVVVRDESRSGSERSPPPSILARRPRSSHRHPCRGGDGATPVGSRLALEFAMSTGANFVTPAAFAVARRRVASVRRSSN